MNTFVQILPQYIIHACMHSNMTIYIIKTKQNSKRAELLALNWAFPQQRDEWNYNHITKYNYTIIYIIVCLSNYI